MKRHPALVPLSHDHHHALARARELGQAAEAGDVAAAERFLRFFAAETTRHFRQEEELVFPLLVGDDDPDAELVQALVEHGRLRALADRLRRAPDPETMLAASRLLTDHVRLEERVLFERVQERVPEAELQELRLGARPLLTGEGPGPVWGTESEDLNATVIVWGPGGGSPDHANDERDVLLVVLEGEALVTIEGESHPLAAGDALVFAKGERRRIDAGRRGVRYLTAHLRRGGLQIRSLGS